jgi:hypothetical protein
LVCFAKSIRLPGPSLVFSPVFSKWREETQGVHLVAQSRNVEELSPAQLVELIKGYRYAVGSETDFQRGIEEVLARHSIVFLREHQLGPQYGRIDFYLPEHKYGIELKVKGSPSEVLRQLHRYALSPDIAALILITGRSRLAFAPISIEGTPLLTTSLWDGQL